MATGKIVLGMAAALAALVAGGPVLAQSCNEDIAAIAARRQAVINVLERSVKAGHGKLDPVASCPVLRKLASIEGEFGSYMAKNKDWCHVPDEALANVQTSQRKTQTMASRACGLVTQIRRARQQQQQQNQQQAAGGGQPQAQRLPAGPL